MVEKSVLLTCVNGLKLMLTKLTNAQIIVLSLHYVYAQCEKKAQSFNLGL